MKKKTWIIASVAILAVVLIGAVGLFFALQHTKNTDKLSGYTILVTEEDREPAQSLQRLAKSRFAITVPEYGSLSAKLRGGVIQFTSDYTIVPGYTGGENPFPESAFAIFADEAKNLYLYGANESAKRCAVYELLYKRVAEDGTVDAMEDRIYESGLDRFEHAECLTNLEIEGGKNTEAANLLQYYLCAVTGTEVPVVESLSGGRGFLLSTDCDRDRISEEDGIITLESDSGDGLLRVVRQFANRYLGFYFAGEQREHYKASGKELVLEIANEPDEPWIETREPIITLWNTDYPRGYFANENVTHMTDVMRFSQNQLYEYVRMFAFCGYNGIQVTDMCSAWSKAGGYETVQEKIRLLFDAAHSLGMTTTLWVWGSEFDGYGWVDPEVTVALTDHAVRENETAKAVFDRYYSIYAQLADCTDRLISHNYDPGNLSEEEDIAYFALRLWDKFKAVNPDCKLGVSCWGDKFDTSKLFDALGNDVIILGGTQKDDPDRYMEFRNFSEARGLPMGIWSWNNCEMEIDQLAQVNFNAGMIQDCYLTAKKYDAIKKPILWCEMDSNHVTNVFSHYIAGKLLQNPEQDVKHLTYSVARAAVGDAYAADLAEALLVLEEARSADYNRFLWADEQYGYTSESYPAEKLMESSEQAIAKLEAMTAAGVEAYLLPTPIPMTDVLRLLTNALRQVEEFATFRVHLNALSGEAEGLDREELSTKLYAIATPVHEYNLVTGAWGSTEYRAQNILLERFCEKWEIPVPVYPYQEQLEKNRISSFFASKQIASLTRLEFFAPYYEYGLAFGEQKTNRLVEELVQDGILTLNENGSVSLTDWTNYLHRANY